MSMAQRTIGDLVAEDYLRAGVFNQYDIDFCCGGKRTLAAACEKQEIPLDEIEQALQSTGRNGTGSARRPGNWAPDFLADYIENEHHAYVRESIPVLRAFTQKVARVHDSTWPELVDIAGLFEELAAELLRHTEEEEEMLFPYIRALVAAAEGKPAPEHVAAFETVQEPIQSMEDDHERAGEIMRRIRALSDDFTPPEGACNTYRASFAKLEEFETDLHRHVHLENNLLFPKTAALEAERLGR